ncbi:arylsulfatase J-like [Oratosquilla oratoria]|uniref:arylsulfatase J-like n=1 Tax=Oratosquilla oratoria TaxID=337810 RepID=UPI003F764C2D
MTSGMFLRASAVVFGIQVFLGLLQACRAQDSPPNIIFILADDMGWNDVSWHNAKVISPNLQDLHDNGISLNQHYVQPVCTPTRSALMTGYYPYKLGRQRGAIRPKQPTGLSLNHTLLPERLQELGYATHLVGKWHLGFCDWAYTPTRRGYDTFYGLLLGSGDYYNHTRFSGYDFRDQDEVDMTAFGKYSTNLFADRSVEIIKKARAEGKPFFLSTFFQNIHGPLEVPQKYVDMYPSTMAYKKRVLLGSMTAMDDAVGQIVQALKDEDLFNNTIIVFSGDNGAPSGNKGSNLPLRGNKGSVWEGGVRSPAFIHSPLLGSAYIYNNIFHVTDWYNTLLEAASSQGESVTFANDGFSHWKWLLQEAGEAEAPRDTMVYNLDLTKTRSVKGALRKGHYKYIVGSPTTTDKNTGPWLFNIDSDPYESQNLMEILPELAEYMQAELEFYGQDVATRDEPEDDPAGDPSNFGGIWSPGWCTPEV